jgi:hypothetical protein
MRIFKTKWFARFARRVQIEDRRLCDSIVRAERGIVDADLGGGVLIRFCKERARKRR